MLAPRRAPPCFTASVAALNTLMNETGPDAMPLVDRTGLFLGRRREKEKPVPPLVLWMKAVCLSASKIPSIESSMGRTKQAESCAESRPAFISVGELGRKSSEDRIWWNSRAVAEGSRRPRQG